MSERDSGRPANEAARSQPAARRPYATPTLVEYGNVAKLTQSGGITKSEAGVPNMMG
jgi:hypothetical protein